MEPKFGIFTANGADKRMNGIEGSGLVKLNTPIFKTPELAIEFIDESDWIPGGPEYLVLPIIEHRKVRKG